VTVGLCERLTGLRDFSHHRGSESGVQHFDLMHRRCRGGCLPLASASREPTPGGPLRRLAECHGMKPNVGAVVPRTFGRRHL
jgi:hypothetical protein